MAGNETKAEREIRLLKVLTLSIAKADNFIKALDICLREICKTTGWSYGEVWMLSPDNNILYNATVYYGDDSALKAFYEKSNKFTFSISAGLPGLIWQNQQAYWIRDIASDSRFVRKDLALQYNLQSALFIPIVASKSVIAVMAFFMRESQEDQDLVDLLLAVVSQLGVLFEQINLNDNNRKINRALRVLSDCNESIIRAIDESSLLHDICRVAVDPGGYRMALVAFAERDERKSITVITHAGFSGNYIEQLGHLSWADNGQGAGLSSTAIRSGKPYIIRDTSSDPGFTRWKDAAAQQGFRSVISLPLSINNEVIGVLNMYASEINAFDPEEVRLLMELADDTAYAIKFLRTGVEKQRIQSQLFQAQKMEAMGQLAAGVAHDFKNMLTAISGYATLLYNSPVMDNQLKNNAEQIINASDKALNLVDSLLVFGRKHADNLISMDINQTIMQSSGMLKQLLGVSVILSMDLAPGQILILGNGNQLEQVLMNITVNARDAMPAGGTLTIQTRIVEIDSTFIKEHGFGRLGKFACISVVDSGTGMDKATTEKIFDPFFTTKPVGKGTGLGMSVSYSIVKQHKGYIDVQSEVSTGSTFLIYLPLRKDG